MSHEALSGHTCNLPSFPGQPWPGWSFWRRGPPAATTGLNGRRRRATAVVAILIRESCGCTAVAEVAPGTDDGRRLRVDFSLHDHQYSVITAYTPCDQLPRLAFIPACTGAFPGEHHMVFDCPALEEVRVQHAGLLQARPTFGLS